MSKLWVAENALEIEFLQALSIHEGQLRRYPVLDGIQREGRLVVPPYKRAGPWAWVRLASAHNGADILEVAPVSFGRWPP